MEANYQSVKFYPFQIISRKTVAQRLLLLTRMYVPVEQRANNCCSFFWFEIIIHDFEDELLVVREY